MGKATQPHILIVDDEADRERSALAQWKAAAHFTVLHPQDVTHDDISEADVILVDYRIEQWPERDNIGTISLQPKDGLALAAVLRAHARFAPSPTAFALRSAHLNELSSPLPPESRLHILAQALNLEWVFSKSSGSSMAEMVHQVITLALAVRNLPSTWPLDNFNETRKLVEQFMAIPEDASWAAQAWQDIEACHPPIHELVEQSHGLAFLRWLLHRILPYPCFLWDSYHLAARLRVTHASLQSALDSNFSSLLEPCRYKGALIDFLGLRWWRCGIEAFIWELTEGDPFDPQRVRDLLAWKTGRSLEPAVSSQLVVCVDENYQPLSEARDPTEAVRIQPDDWPPYAELAWTTITLARKTPRLAALVLEQDREQLIEGQ